MDARDPLPAEVPARSLRKRGQIARAATALFLEHGYDAVSMENVARVAGVSKATLYAHFVSKDKLFTTILNEEYRNSQINDALFPTQVADLRATLLAIGQCVLRFLLQPRTLAIVRIAIAESDCFPALGEFFQQRVLQRFDDYFCSWLEILLGQGLVKTPDPRIATRQFMALLRSDLFLRACLDRSHPPDNVQIDATVTAAVDAWLCVYGQPGEPQSHEGYVEGRQDHEQWRKPFSPLTDGVSGTNPDDESNSII